MKDRLTAVVLALLLLGLLIAAATGYAQELFAVPLLYALWLLRLIYISIPQQLTWLVALALVALAVGRGMFQSRPLTRRLMPTRARPTPVTAWASLIREAERDDYSRWLLAQRLASLAGSTLAAREQGTPQAAWHYLADPDIAIPSDVRAYLIAGTRTNVQPRPRWAWPWRGDARAATPLDLDPAVVVEWLEHDLQLDSAD